MYHILLMMNSPIEGSPKEPLLKPREDQGKTATYFTQTTSGKVHMLQCVIIH